MAAPNIIQAIHDPALFRPMFKDLGTWRAWLVFLRALFALPMSVTDLELYRRCTGRTSAPSRRVSEAALVKGRRGGGSFTVALIAVYCATFIDW